MLYTQIKGLTVTHTLPNINDPRVRFKITSHIKGRVENTNPTSKSKTNLKKIFSILKSQI